MMSQGDNEKRRTGGAAVRALTCKAKGMHVKAAGMNEDSRDTSRTLEEFIKGDILASRVNIYPHILL